MLVENYVCSVISIHALVMYLLVHNIYCCTEPHTLLCSYCQETARHVLLRQQEELRNMREKQMCSHEQRQICEQLSHVKDEVNRYITY